MFFVSLIGKRLKIEKSTLFWLGPRRMLRPTLPMSVQTMRGLEQVASVTAALRN